MKKFILFLFLLSIIVSGQKKRDELFNEVEIMLDVAKNDNADILCEESYNSAVEFYETAIEKEENSESPIKIRESLEKSISFLTKMNDKIDVKKELFATTLEKRNTALDSGADKHAEYFWNLGEMKLQEALDDFDDGDVALAAGKTKTIQEYYSTAKLYSNKANSILNNSNSLAIANSNFANLLAPRKFEKGMNSLNETLDEISNGKKLSVIDKHISDTDLLFDEASLEAVKFREDYPEVVAERKNAKIVDAEKHTLELWQEAEGLLKESAEEYENEDYGAANELAMNAKDKYLSAKHISIKEYFLNDAKAKIEDAIDGGAEEFAPITLGKSQSYFDEASNLIEDDSYSLPELKRVVNNAQLSAENAIYITSVAKKMEPGEQSWEEIILSKQGKEINKIEEEIPDEVASSEGYSAVASDLADYLQDEAEVIDEKDMITLRLKNVKFATMSSRLNEESKASLNRVSEALKQNPRLETTVVSYTDNIGTKSSNKALSQKRAEEVYNFIKKRNNVTSLKFEGRGETNPIATNSNSEGRNKNRRIEIEILK